MPSFRQKLPALSRDRVALIKGSAIILGIFFLAGIPVGKMGGSVDFYVLLMAAVSVCGLIWFTVITKLGGVRRILELRLLYAVLAFVLGVYSAITTGHTIRWYESISGLHENGETINDLIFYICRVGFQEEFIKMLFILPLVPFVLRRRSEAEMLLISSCVGLGFAVEENIYYFNKEIASTLGRLLTANFSHLAMTGAIGLALFRFIRWPKTRWEEFIGTFLIMVILHGLYDAFISVPALKEYSVVSFVIFGIIAHRHFDKIAETREPVTQKISPLGVFIIGCAMLLGLTWVFAYAMAGFHPAIQITGQAGLGTAVVAFLYINRLRAE